MRIGPIALASPVVLAPMAGVTNVAFRTLCRELEVARAGTVSGLYVCEMVTARALVERHPATMHMVTFAPDEEPRSLQLYTVDPDTTYAAARMIAVGGVYDPRIHLDEVVMPVLKKWRIFEREDFSGQAARERDDLAVLIKELEVACDKFEVSKQRQLEREARRGDLRLTALQLHNTEGKLTLSRR